MSEDRLVEAMNLLTDQLKGAPLREDEKDDIKGEFDKASGSDFDRTISAIANILHAPRSLICEKGRALHAVDEVLQDVRKAADENT